MSPNGARALAVRRQRASTWPGAWAAAPPCLHHSCHHAAMDTRLRLSSRAWRTPRGRAGGPASRPRAGRLRGAESTDPAGVIESSRARCDHKPPVSVCMTRHGERPSCVRLGTQIVIARTSFDLAPPRSAESARSREAAPARGLAGRGRQGRGEGHRAAAVSWRISRWRCHRLRGSLVASGSRSP
jgi:hypothetical protein